MSLVCEKCKDITHDKCFQPTNGCFQLIKKDFEEQVEKTFGLSKPKHDFERSKLARATDYLAAIPFIGSLFALVRIIGSAGVAIYYTYHKTALADMMLLRAKDEYQRGLTELIPFVRLVWYNTHPLAIEQSASGNYYCPSPDGKELCYAMTSLKNKTIQQIRGDQITSHTHIHYVDYTGLAGHWTEREERVFTVKDQIRWIPDCEEPAELNLNVCTSVDCIKLIPIDRLL